MENWVLNYSAVFIMILEEFYDSSTAINAGAIKHQNKSSEMELERATSNATSSRGSQSTKELPTMLSYFPCKCKTNNHQIC